MKSSWFALVGVLFGSVVFSSCEDKKPEQRVGAEYKANPDDTGLSDNTPLSGGNEPLNDADAREDSSKKENEKKESTASAENKEGAKENATTPAAGDVPSSGANASKETSSKEAETKETDNSNIPNQCQAKLWSTCRKAEGLTKCNIIHNCTEETIKDAALANEAKSADCKNLEKYKECRLKSPNDGEKIALCDKEFQCTVADVTLNVENQKETKQPDETTDKAEEGGSGPEIENANKTGPEFDFNCNEAGRKLCHTGGGGFSCDTKYSCKSPIVATSGSCYKEAFNLCKKGSPLSHCMEKYFCSESSNEKVTKETPVQPSRAAKPKASASCVSAKRDICLSNGGGFGCYTKFSCPELVSFDSNLCDSYGLGLCLKSGYGQMCYTASKCASAGVTTSPASTENTDAASSESASRSTLPVAAVPQVRLDQTCFKKLYKICRNGGGGEACSDQSLAKYTSCRR